MTASKQQGVGLLDVEPDLVRFLTEEQREVAERFTLPLAVAERDDDVERLLRDAGAFGALVLDGLLVQVVSVDTQSTLSLIGPGGIAPVSRQPRSVPSLAARVLAAARTELVLLGDEFLLASRRWPWLVDTLHARMMEQSERVMTQLAACQLPRVEDRLMAMMWLLADRWGHVTPAGIRLDLALSHETLGGLIGARRPTVTLAIKKLAERNTLIRQDQEWLITEPPPEPDAGSLENPVRLFRRPQTSPWAPPAAPRPEPDGLQVFFEDATSVREDGAYQRKHAATLCSESTELCARSRELSQVVRGYRTNRARPDTRGRLAA